jgi:hypothetical protein
MNREPLEWKEGFKTLSTNADGESETRPLSDYSSSGDKALKEERGTIVPRTSHLLQAQRTKKKPDSTLIAFE